MRHHRPSFKRAIVLSLASMAVHLGALAGCAPALGAPRGTSAADKSQDRYYELLSRDTVGADAFTAAHPTWDGRGVVIAVLDTGVDPTVPGLKTTTTGGPKVIETRDFSGQGDITLVKATVATEEGVTHLRTDAGVVRGYDKLPKKPADGTWYLGFFEEASLKNSDVNDVDRDGRTDDRFAVVAFKPAGEEEAVCAIDLDGDGDVSDEVLRPSYRVDRTPFIFPNVDPRKNQTPVGFTVSVLLDEPKVELHFDDGAHGTHCAGISAGHGIHGRKGFDGIAPGAAVISLKIGHNGLAGGATTEGSMKKAIAYASKWAKDHKVPVVINLSYGVGSELEGESAIDQVLTEALEKNRLLVASVAAGNEGPGLSTVGTPGASARAWTAAALLNPANANALWGGQVKRDSVFSFSSRGGELAKPDGLAPGVAWSTVPPFMESSVMAGTSMATPQAAGVHALLLSGALQANVKWTSGSLKRALRSSAKPLPGYTRLDQGAGLIRVGPAFEALKRFGRHDHVDTLLDWNVSTAIPSRPGHQGSASYWRTGGYVPRYPHTIRFELEPVFLPDVSDAAKKGYFDRFSLSASPGWLDVDRSSLAFGPDGGHVDVRIDADDLDAPGLYVGVVRATLRGVGQTAFSLPVSVVVPHRFLTPKDRSRTFDGALDPGEIQRFFVEVPPGATAMHFRMSTPGKRFGKTYLNVFDPDGRPVAYERYVADSRAGGVVDETLSGGRLRPGVWELVPYATFRNKERSHFQLVVSFTGLSLEREVTYSIPEGGTPEASIEITNRFAAPFLGTGSATLSGSARRETIDVEGTRHSQPLVLAPGESSVELELSVSPDDYNLFSDLAVLVEDSAGQAVMKEAFGNRFLHATFRGTPGTYTLRLIGGSSTGETDLNWHVDIHEVHGLAKPIPVSVEGPEGATIALYPNIKTTLELTSQAAFTELPDGFVHRVDLTLRHAKTGQVWMKLPLDWSR